MVPSLGKCGSHLPGWQLWSSEGFVQWLGRAELAPGSVSILSPLREARPGLCGAAESKPGLALLAALPLLTPELESQQAQPEQGWQQLWAVTVTVPCPQPWLVWAQCCEHPLETTVPAPPSFPVLELITWP